MSNTSRRKVQRLRRKVSIRKRVQGSSERPRMVVYRSLAHIYAQVIDDDALNGSGKVLAEASSRGKELRAQAEGLKKRELAEKVGEAVAKACLDQGIKQVVFDRNGFLYHGRVAAVADGARKAGLSL